MAVKPYRENFSAGEKCPPVSYFEATCRTAGQSMYLHWHERPEILLAQSGSGIAELDLKQHKISSGDIIFIPPDTVHSVYSSEGIFCKALVIDTALLSAAGIGGREMQRGAIVHKNALFYSDMITGFAVAAGELTAKDAAYVPAACAAVINIYSMLLRCGSAGTTMLPNETPDTIETVKKTLVYIKQNFEKDISVDTLADNAGYSKFYFMHFFKQCTNMTVTDYINMVRLENAAAMLGKASSSVSLVAESCGIPNTSYFIRLFKNRYGVTPAVYKRQRL